MGNRPAATAAVDESELKHRLPAASLRQLPPILRAPAEQSLQHWYLAAAEQDRSWFAQVAGKEPQLLQEWLRAVACSPWLAEQCIRHPAILRELHSQGILHNRSDRSDFESRLAAAGEPDSATTLAAQLRRFRRREMIRLIWRDLNRLAELVDTCRETSLLAETCLDAALDWHYRELCHRFGTPRSVDGQPQRLTVIGLGKLGGEELNLSSDLDLMFAWPESGETDDEKYSCSNQEFFERLGRQLIDTLHAKTRDGFVFRIDMRLRPHGSNGALVMNFNSLETYYESQGRDWERYALCKARPVAGDRSAGQTLLNRLQAFVYRRYLDFGALEALRDMARGIRDALPPTEMDSDLKRGTGGIREIEFTAQFLQLVFGGVNRKLRHSNLLQTLEILGAEGYLKETRELQDAYIFLRNSEHALQAFGDCQTHSLPEDELEQQALSLALGQDGPNRYMTVLNHHRQKVHTIFEELTRVERPGDEDCWNAMWDGDHDRAQELQILQKAGFAEPDQARDAIVGLRESRVTKMLQAVARSRLNRFMPLLLRQLSELPRPDRVLQRVLPLVEQILRRSTYLSMLNENPNALRQLLRLCAESSWISEQLRLYPAQIDELLDPAALYAAADASALQTELNSLLGGIPAEDTESLLNALRQFRIGKTLGTAAQELRGDLDPQQVGRRLSDIAEALLQAILSHCRHRILLRHGGENPAAARTEHPAEFAIIAYGGLGSMEMNYGSDLDLVFLYDGEAQGTVPGTGMDIATYCNRLGRDILNCISTQTLIGSLYHIDTRLRPSGRAGMLVSNFNTFARYQRNSAWTWEHQALVKARPVCGDSGLRGNFSALRAEILARPRKRSELQQAVRDMRARIAEHNTPGAGSDQSLKTGDGGLVDIEFLVQYSVLLHAATQPKLIAETSNDRLLLLLAEQELLSQQDAATLSAAWREINALLHLRKLGGEEAADSAERLAALNAAVASCRHRIITTAPDE